MLYRTTPKQPVNISSGKTNVRCHRRRRAFMTMYTCGPHQEPDFCGLCGFGFLSLRDCRCDRCIHDFRRVLKRVRVGKYDMYKAQTCLDHINHGGDGDDGGCRYCRPKYGQSIFYCFDMDHCPDMGVDICLYGQKLVNFRPTGHKATENETKDRIWWRQELRYREEERYQDQEWRD